MSDESNAFLLDQSNAPLRVVKRFSKKIGGWAYIGNNRDAVNFVASRDIILLGIGLYVPYQLGTKNTVKITINYYKLGEYKDPIILLDKSIDVLSEENSKETGIFSYYFDKNIDFSIDSMTKVGIVLTTIGSNTYGGECGNSVINSGDVTFTFSASIESKNGTTTTTGQIPEIYFTYK